LRSPERFDKIVSNRNKGVEKVITSSANQLCKLVISLHQKKGRLEHGLYLAEGIHLVSEAVSAKVQIREILWSKKLEMTKIGRNLLAQLGEKIPQTEISETIFQKLGETENSQGVIALIEIPKALTFNLMSLRTGIILDGLQDPGNVGTIIRTAWASGLDGIFCMKETADPYQGKVVRASMGGIFHQKIYQNFEPKDFLAILKGQSIQIVAGEAGAKQSYFEVDLCPNTLFLVGNEGSGLNVEWKNVPIKQVSIPQPGRAESLNVGISAALLIYEAIRQRIARDSCKN